MIFTCYSGYLTSHSKITEAEIIQGKKQMIIHSGYNSIHPSCCLCSDLKCTVTLEEHIIN